MFCGEGEGLTDWTVEENKVTELRMEGWGGEKVEWYECCFSAKLNSGQSPLFD